MGKARIDLDAACAPAAGLADDGDQPAVALDDLLWVDLEVVEAVEPAAEEALEALAARVSARLGALLGLVPLDLRVEQIENDRQVASVQRLISALGQIASPATAFYDSNGRLEYVKLGGYLKEQDLAADIERYAR